jgi:hypothetical protein
MQTIELTGSAGAKAKVLEPYVGERIIVYLVGDTFSIGTLRMLDKFKATINCEESGDEFFIRYSDMTAVSVRSPGNWNSSNGNASNAKTERLQIRCTLEQRIVIERAAVNSKRNLGEFVLQAALYKAKIKNSERKR